MKEHLDARKRLHPEQMVSAFPQVEVLVAKGKATDQTCRRSGIVKQTYYRWRKECGGLKADQAKRLKELDQ